MVIAALVVALQQSAVSTRIREENQRTRVHNLLKLDIGRSEASRGLFMKSLLVFHPLWGSVQISRKFVSSSSYAR